MNVVGREGTLLALDVDLQLEHAVQVKRVEGLAGKALAWHWMLTCS